MKIKMIRLLVLTFVVTGFQSCNIFAEKGNGNVIRSDRQISSFGSLVVSGALNVQLVQDDVEKVTVETDSNLQKHVIVESRNNTLIVRSTKQLKNPTKLTVYISFKSLEEMEIKGACSLKGMKKLNFENISFDVSGASSLEIDFISSAAEIEGSGASELNLKGACQHLEADLSGASSLSAIDFTAKKVQMEASGASSITVGVTEDLAATASGASSIRYKGSPAIRKSKATGAGSIKSVE